MNTEIILHDRDRRRLGELGLLQNIYDKIHNI